jgi:hypothetical protein
LGKESSMIIGVPREIKADECRLAAAFADLPS